MTISFTPCMGGHVVRVNRHLVGLILQPYPHSQEWRILTEHGESTTADTLQDAKRVCADLLIHDH